MKILSEESKTTGLFIKYVLLVLIVIKTNLVVYCQSNPLPFNLGSGNYSFTSWANTSPAGTYPANMYLHTCSQDSNPTLGDATTGDYSAAYNLATGNRFTGLTSFGLSVFNKSKSQPTIGAVVIGLNTTGRTNITVSWESRTWAVGNSYNLRLQYRISPVSLWLDVPGPIEYIYTGVVPNIQTLSVNLSTATSGAIDNRPNMQLRWKYHYINGISASSNTLSIDEINISSVSLIQGPTVTLNSSSSEYCPGSSDGSIDINVSGGTAPYSYVWNNGSTSQDINSISAGTYTVTVTDNTGLTASLSQVISVTNQLPSALTTLTGPSSACIGTSLSFNVNVSSGATTYQWSTPNNSTVISGQGTNTVIVSFASGFNGGNLCVTASNSCGNTTSLCKNISSVIGLPASPDSVSGPSQICPGDTIFYSTNITANTTSYNWTVPTGCSIINGIGSNNITIAVNSSFASGTVSVTSVNACGLSPITRNKNVTRKPVPATPGTISGTAYGICGLTRSYSVTLVSGVGYLWTAPSGATIISGQGTNTVSVQYSTGFTNGNISVVATNACGNSNVRTKTVYGKPSKPTSISGPILFCTKDTVTYSTPTVFGATTYTWTIPSGLTILSGQGTNIITVKGGTVSVSGDVCVKTGNTCGSTSNFCYSINVYPTPNSISGITGSTNGVCSSSKYYSVPSQSGITFTWSVPVGATILSGQGTRQINVSFSGLFTTGDIDVTASSACGTSVTAFKTINGAPSSPSSITGPTSTCFNAQNVSYSCTSVSGATSYQWTIPAGATIVSGQGTQNLVLNYNAVAGTSSPLKVRSVNSCGQSNNRTVNIAFQSCPREGNAKEEFAIYPNPSSDEITVFYGGDRSDVTSFRIYDLQGKEVLATHHSRIIRNNHNRVSFNTVKWGVFCLLDDHIRS